MRPARAWHSNEPLCDSSLCSAVFPEGSRADCECVDRVASRLHRATRSTTILQEVGSAELLWLELVRDGCTGDSGKKRVQLAHSLAQRGGTGLQNDGGRDFVDMAIARGAGGNPAGARKDVLLVDLHAAPRSEDDLWIEGHNSGCVDDPVLGFAAAAQLREDRVAAGDFDQLFNPADATDER